ncbi:MAG: hypothetical protein IV100_23745 [Myxococcales bacterium]|nr:hypothetical protein [Myxococcales bacterium]
MSGVIFPVTSTLDDGVDWKSLFFELLARTKSLSPPLHEHASSDDDLERFVVEFEELYGEPAADAAYSFERTNDRGGIAIRVGELVFVPVVEVGGDDRQCIWLTRDCTHRLTLPMHRWLANTHAIHVTVQRATAEREWRPHQTVAFRQRHFRGARLRQYIDWSIAE